MQTTIIEYAEQFQLAETDGGTTTITETSASLLQNSLDVQTVIGLEALLKGEKGDKGDAGDPATTGALAIMNRLSEFDTTQAKADALMNLGINIVDGGTF
jgi:hypothetical protein